MAGLKTALASKLFGKKKTVDTSGFQKQADGSVLVNGKKYPKGTQEDDPSLPKMTPTSGKPAISVGNPKKVNLRR